MDKQTEAMILTGLSSLSTAVAALLAMQPNNALFSQGQPKDELIASMQESANNLTEAATRKSRSEAQIVYELEEEAFGVCSCGLFSVDPDCQAHGGKI